MLVPQLASTEPRSALRGCTAATIDTQVRGLSLEDAMTAYIAMVEAVGDSSDGYPGLPGCGDRHKMFASEEWLTCTTEQEFWLFVQKRYLEAALAYRVLYKEFPDHPRAGESGGFARKCVSEAMEQFKVTSGPLAKLKKEIEDDLGKISQGPAAAQVAMKNAGKLQVDKRYKEAAEGYLSVPKTYKDKKSGKVLKAMLRQAPNVILVGEIRDKEVADVAIQAALTGHLVFSTLHTNDAPSAITRLIDMGVKPFLVASALQAVLAQRLMRNLCDNCKVPDPHPNAKEMAILEMTKADIAGKTLYKAVGCDVCGGTGFKGRRGIYEMMLINNEIRELAFKRAPVNQIRAAAIANGMRNLLGDGKLRILDGGTTTGELCKIAQAEGVVEMDEEEDAA